MNQSCSRLAAFVLLAIVPVVTGCSTSKPKAEPKPEKLHERGWIGGEYKRVSGPKSLAEPPATADTNHTRKPKPPHGLLITALSTNSPAYLAGLREGDLVLELNHKPIESLKEFHLTIDQCQPGTPVMLKAWHEGQLADFTVPTGRETFRNGGLFGIELPFYWERLDLWPNPGFSLCVLGYKTAPVNRPELGSVENTYRRESLGDKTEAYNYVWRTWLVIFAVERGEHIVSQEVVR